MIRIVPLDSAVELSLSPDTIWDGVSGDLALAGVETGNVMGLRARAHLATAVLLCLMSDARVEADELPPDAANRGWPGDSFDLRDDLGERPIGSKLWLLRRSTINERTAQLAADYARSALDCLIAQGAVASVDVVADVRPAGHRLDLTVTLRDRDGAVLFDGRFGVIWEQMSDLDRPLDK